MSEDIPARIDFLLETEKLKSVLRRTSPAYLDRLENSAEHSWSLAVMAILFADLTDEPVRLENVLKMVTVHDLVEIHAGDTYCYDLAGNAGKAEREQQAADLLFASLPAEQASAFRNSWDEFESGLTPDARFANGIDRLLPLIQHRAHHGAIWKANGITKDQVLKRIAPLGEISTALHGYALQLINESVAAGWLAG